MTEFEKCLRYGRIDKKMSQRELAELAGIAAAELSRLESGMFVPLEKERVDRIAQIIDTDCQMLWSMYTAAFCTELREMRGMQGPQGMRGQHRLGSLCGMEDNDAGADGDSECLAGRDRVVLDEKGLALVNTTLLLADLEDIQEEIMKLPVKTRDAVVPLIKMLVSSYGASASA